MKEIKKIGVCGAGTMGYSMAQAFSKDGYPVMLYDLFPAALEKAEKFIKVNQEGEVAVGKITAEESAEIIARISMTSDINDMKDCDFIIEAVAEKLEIKHTVYKQLSEVVAEDAILASNTSGLSITKIAEAVKNPGRFCGMHWMNPPHLIPLIEVIKGEKSDDETVEQVKEIALKLKKKPVIVKDAPSFVLNRLQQAIIREASYIVAEGITTPEGVDDVMKYALGFRYACFGPFETCDLGGLDIHNNISVYTYPDLCKAQEPFGIIADAVAQGNLGVKTGKGVYDYSDGKDVEMTKRRDYMFNKLAKCLFEEE